MNNLFQISMLMIMGISREQVIFQYEFLEVILFGIKKLSTTMKTLLRL